LRDVSLDPDAIRPKPKAANAPVVYPVPGIGAGVEHPRHVIELDIIVGLSRLVYLVI